MLRCNIAAMGIIDGHPERKDIMHSVTTVPASTLILDRILAALAAIGAGFDRLYAAINVSNAYEDGREPAYSDLKTLGIVD